MSIPTTKKQCKNFKIAYEFLSKHEWPEKLSDRRFNRCYCESCYSEDLEDTCLVGGRTYVVPRGYTRIGVHIDQGYADHHKIWDTWNNCYHGTSIKSAISIIVNRGPLLPGDVTMEGDEIAIRECHIPKQNFFFTTPTIKYAEDDCYASSYDFKSPSDGRTYSLTVVLQLKQKPDTFIVQPETIGAGSKRLCPYIKNEEIEWKSMQRTSVVPYGLLLRIEDVGKDLSKRLKKKLKRSDSSLYNSLLAHLTDWEQVECPHCKHLNDWVNPSESQGIILTCEAISCGVKFKPLKCIKCDFISTYCDCFTRFNNERIFKCDNSECDLQFLSRMCPHCLVSCNFCKEPCDNQTVPVKCSEAKCGNSYEVFMCPHCKNLKHEKYVGKKGVIVTCNDSECLQQCQLAKCPECKRVNVYKYDALMPGRGGTIKCAYKGCNSKFKQP